MKLSTIELKYYDARLHSSPDIHMYMIYICNEDTSMLVLKLRLPLKLYVVADVCLIILVESN
jgi:hypothetical protein